MAAGSDERFTLRGRVIWWSAQPGARKKAREEFDKLPKDARGQLALTMERTLRGKTRRHDQTKLDKHIWEWRQRIGNNHFRILYFTWGRYYVAVSAFYKNQQKVPPADLRRANSRRATWVDTHGRQPPDGWCDR